MQRDTRPARAGVANCYSIVRGFRVGDDACSLFLEDPAEKLSRIEVGVSPDRHGVAELRSQGLHAMSVKLELSLGGDLSCSALFRSAAGPVRLAVSEGVALALCVDGRHTVVTRRREART